MRVKMQHAWSAPLFSYLVDSVQDLDDKVASQLIKDGHAVEHNEPDPPPTISRRQQRENARKAEVDAKASPAAAPVVVQVAPPQASGGPATGPSEPIIVVEPPAPIIG